MRLLSYFAAIGLWTTGISGMPYLGPNGTDPFLNFDLVDGTISRRGLANNVQLRIMCLGASIVYGYGSTDGNGFRYALRNKLVYDGNPVNMVGSVTAGSMADNNVEGWGGFIIDQMRDKAALTVGSQPNLILIHVGSNDMGFDLDVANAHNRLGALIDWLFASIPDVTIVASTLLPQRDFAIRQRVNVYNSNIPGMIQARQKAGKKITYVDFSSPWFTLADLIADGIHPNDNGFKKMAAVWHQGITVAANAGFITPPRNVPGVSDIVVAGTTCDKVPGNIQGPFQIQFGSGTNDGPYVHTGVSVGGFNGFNNSASLGYNNPVPEGVYWADINGDGIDDYVYVAANANGGFGVALSSASGTLGTYLWSPFAAGCLRAGVRFADMTGDGRDDYCCIAPNGDLYVWQNTAGSDARAPVWKELGLVKGGTGIPRERVHLADIDGDGRADYVGFDAAGTSIWGWRNGAMSNVQTQWWTPFGGVATGLPSLNMSGWTFADLNGDHRDDLVWVNPNGQVTTWINQRGFVGGSLAPAWQSMGVTHGGGSVPITVAFGAFMGSGRADYSVVTADPSGSVLSNVHVERYRNDDHGGVRVKADGDRYCDMTGSGSDDYIWLSVTGEVTVYGNLHSPGSWTQWGVVYNVGQARKDVGRIALQNFAQKANEYGQIRFADFDGDKKCDILIVDKTSGKTTVLRNDFANGKFAFTNIGVVTGSATCTEGNGYLDHDLAVRWNDIDGDGRADFLCMKKNGIITGYLNKGVGNMVWQGQIKHYEGRERADLRLADMDGDGKDDLVWLDNKSGQLRYWKNMGTSGDSVPATNPNSAFGWLYKGVGAVGGGTRGSAIELANMNGLGRADYINIDAQQNFASVLYNICPGGGLAPITPDLPAGAPPAPAYPLGGPTTTNPPTPPPTSTTLPGVFLEEDPNCLSFTACSTCKIEDDINGYFNDERWAAGKVDEWAQKANNWYAGQMADDYGNPGIVLNRLRGQYGQALIWHYGGQDAPQNWDCGTIGSSSCVGSRSCTQVTITGGEGQVGLVQTSWANMHSFYNNMWTSLLAKEANLLSEVPAIVKLFSPSVDPPDTPAEIALKVMGYFSSVLGLASANFWGKFFSDATTFDSFKNGVAKVTAGTTNANALVAFVGSFADSKVSAFQQEFNKQNDLTSVVGYLVTALQGVIADFVQHLFDGSGEGMLANQGVIQNGYFLTPPYNMEDKSKQGVYAFYPMVNEVLYSRIIPIAWKLDPDVFPVLIYRDLEAGADPVVNPSQDMDQRDHIIIDDDDALAARVPYGGTVLWLLDLHTCHKHSPAIVTARQCDGPIFRPLPGLGDIGSISTFGGLTKENMYVSAYRGWLANYKQNGYGLEPQGTTSVLPFSTGYATPGFFQFPLCEIGEAYQNWAKYFDKNITKDACENYPCCGYTDPSDL